MMIEVLKFQIGRWLVGLFCVRVGGEEMVSVSMKRVRVVGT